MKINPKIAKIVLALLYFLYNNALAYPNEDAFRIVSSKTGPLCEGETLVLTTEGCSSTVTWTKNGEDFGSGASKTIVASFSTSASYSAHCGQSSDTYGLEVRETLPLNIISQPQNQTVCLGQNAVLDIDVNPDLNYNFQWFLNDNPIVGANSASYSIASVSSSNFGTYKVVISNDDDCILGGTSNEAILSENTGGNLVHTQEEKKACVAESVTLTAKTTLGAGTIQWFKNSVLIAGATLQNYTFTASLSDVNVVYSAVVTSACNTVETSKTLISAVRNTTNVSLNTSLSNQSVCAATNLVVNPNVSNSAASFKWYKGSTLISSALNLTLNSLTNSAAGTYTLKYLNECDNSENTLGSFELEVLSFPIIQVQPVSRTACSGQTIDLFVEGSATNIKWFKNNVLQADLTTNQISFVASASTAGAWHAVLYSDCGQTQSQTANVTLQNAIKPVISKVTPVVCDGSSVNLKVTNCGSDIKWILGETIVGTGQNFVASTSGFYKVNCEAQNCEVIVSSDFFEVKVGGTLSFETILSNVTCPGGNNGSAKITINGGVAPYNFVLSGPVQGTGFSYTNLTAGNYSFIITDANACTQSGVFSIEQPDLPQISIQTSDALCAGNSDGKITLSINRSLENLEYFINGEWKTLHSNIIPNLKKGFYTLMIREGECILMNETLVEIKEPNALKNTNLNVFSPDNLAGNNGYVSVQINGGVAPYQVAFSNSFGESFVPNFGQPTDFQVQNLKKGNYNLEIKDFNGCSISDFYVINASTFLEISEKITDINCFGDSTGAISLNLKKAEDSDGFSVKWFLENSLFQTDSLNITNLKSGVYKLVLANSDLGQKEFFYTVKQPDELKASINLVKDAYCATSDKGEVIFDIAGGTGDFLIEWNSKQFFTNHIKELPSGIHKFLVIDGENCKTSVDVAIKNTSEDFKISPIWKEPSCFGKCDGQLSLDVKGAPYEYQISWTGIQGNLDSACAGGSVQAFLIDSNGCELKSDSLALTQPQAISVTLPSEQEVCPSQPFQLSASQNSWASVFEWTTPNDKILTGAVVTADTVGTYILKATSAQGCSGIGVIEVVPSKDVKMSFMMASQVVVNKDFVVVDFTKPEPESIEWILPSLGKVISKDGSSAVLNFSSVGEFKIRENAVINNCTYSLVRPVSVVAYLEDNGFEPPVSFAPLDMTILGNPVVQNRVALKIKNEVQRNFTVGLASASNGQAVFSRSFSGESGSDISLELPDFLNESLYIITVDNGLEKISKKLVYLR